jgi:hypothetical protein
LRRQRFDQGFCFRTSAQPTHRFQHRVIRFFSSIAFHALSAGNTKDEQVNGSAPLEFVDQRGFSDARLTRNKNDLPLPPQGFMKRAV